MIKGIEFHSIIQNVFDDVKGLTHTEQLQVCCPRCQERDGLTHPDGKYNLEINTAKRVFRCWKCSEPKFSGSLGRLIRIYGTKADYEIYKSFAGSISDYNYDDEDAEYIAVSLPDETILFSQMDVTDPEHIKAYTYLVVDRKISKEIILKYRLGFCTEGKYIGRIIIPSYDIDGNINYFVARSYTKEHKHPYDNPKSDKNRIIFNEGYVNWDSTIYLVEGVFEMLSFPVNTIPLLGKIITITLFEKLKEFKPNIIIVLDPDAYKDSIDLFFTLKNIYIDCEEKIKLVKLPTNDDLDELRRKYGDDAVIKALRTARALNVDDYFEKKMENPYERKRRGYSINSKYYKW